MRQARWAEEQPVRPRKHPDPAAAQHGGRPGQRDCFRRCTLQDGSLWGCRRAGIPGEATWKQRACIPMCMHARCCSTNTPLPRLLCDLKLAGEAVSTALTHWRGQQEHSLSTAVETVCALYHNRLRCTHAAVGSFVLQVAVAVFHRMDLSRHADKATAAQRFARVLHDSWGVGNPDCQNGALLLLAVGDRQVRGLQETLDRAARAVLVLDRAAVYCSSHTTPGSHLHACLAFFAQGDARSCTHSHTRRACCPSCGVGKEVPTATALRLLGAAAVVV